MKDFLDNYDERGIGNHLRKFNNLTVEKQYQEFLFCLLTPQSKAQKCWEAVLEISKLGNYTAENLINILKTRTRFHNVKARRVLQAPETFGKVRQMLKNKEIPKTSLHQESWQFGFLSAVKVPKSEGTLRSPQQAMEYYAHIRDGISNSKLNRSKLQSINLVRNKNKLELRNKISEIVNGYGLKEASHFLRNIGHSENQVAILDRHILRNLHINGVIESPKIKSSKHYLEIEKLFLSFADKLGVLPDHLDLHWWSQENGELFK